MIEYLMYTRSYTFWMVVIVVVIFGLWLFFGGGNYEFVGLSPLHPSKQITPYLTHNDKISYATSGEGVWFDDEEEIDPCAKNGGPCNVDTTPTLPEGFNSTCSEPNKHRDSKGERKCREVLEKLYRRSFPKTRPQFLRNPETGRLLELDCYCEYLALAAEYNGSQHYMWPNYTNQSYDSFIKQRRRDRLKVDLCDLNGVYLITVPYNVPVDEIEDYIIYYLPENVQKRLLEDIEIANEGYLRKFE